MRQMITGRSVRVGSEVRAAGDRVYPLTDAHICEIDAALDRERNAPLYGFGQSGFPLHASADLLARFSSERENDCRCGRAKGLPVAPYTETEAAAADQQAGIITVRPGSSQMRITGFHRAASW